MKILVTGATGFLGHHVISTLVERGVEVVATGRSLSKMKQAPWADAVTLVQMDLDQLPDSLMDQLHHPSHCVHLAWPNLPDYKSETHLNHSLPQSKNFLCKLIDQGIQKILVAGTCFEYGMQEGELSEKLPPRPDNPYGRAKNQLRLELESYLKDKDTDLQWARLFYMYGKGQNPKSLFAQLQKAIQSGCEEFDMSGGQQIRDYLPVEEVAAAIADLICHPTYTGTINVCSGENVPLLDLVKRYLENHNADIKLNLGVFPYPDWEPFKFWGAPHLLEKVRKQR